MTHLMVFELTDELVRVSESNPPKPGAFLILMGDDGSARLCAVYSTHYTTEEGWGLELLNLPWPDGWSIHKNGDGHELHSPTNTKEEEKMIAPDGKWARMWEESERPEVSPIQFDRTRMTDPYRISHDVKPVRSTRDAAERWAWHLWAAHDDDMGDEGWEHWRAGLHDAPHHTIRRAAWAVFLENEVWDGMTPDEHEQLIDFIEDYIITEEGR